MENIKITLRKILLLVLLGTTLFSCNRNPLNIDVKEINVSVKVDRFDQTLCSIDTAKLKEQYLSIENSNLQFAQFYTGDVLKIGTTENEDFYFYLKSFLTDTVMVKVNKKILEVYPDEKKLNNDLTLAFKHFAYYFPNKKVPKIFAVNGGFNYSIFTVENNIGICLDMYLGNNCVYYDYLGVHNYKKFNMAPAKISCDVMKMVAEQEIQYNETTSNLLSNMIYTGKLLYFVDAMCPKVADSLKIGYSNTQLKWCIENEIGIWNYLIDKQLLYSSEKIVLKQFLNDGPFTNVFSDSSPARIGEWLGWQIVKAYMTKNREVTLDSLIKNNDFQSILNNSSYHPQ